MQDEFNPYAAPASTAMHPRAAEWLHSTDDPSLQKVAQGLGLIYLSIIVILASLILMFFLGIAFAAAEAPAAAQRGATGGVPVVVMLGGLGIIVGYILSLVGSFMCLATPAETGAKGLITVSVVMMVLSLVLNVGNFFVENRGTESLASLFSVIGGICFIIFLKRLAQFIGATHLAQRAKNILIALVVGVALMILMLVLALGGGMNIARGGGGGGLAITAFLAILLMIGGLVVFVMYANLINNLRKAIQSGGAVYS
jgi:hypothetical protein